MDYKGEVVGWVIQADPLMSVLRQCPLYPQKRTLELSPVSALCHTQTLSPAFAPIDQTRKGSKSCPSCSFNVMIGIIKAEHMFLFNSGRTTDAD